MSETDTFKPNHRHTEVVSAEQLHYLQKAAENMGDHAVVQVVVQPGEEYIDRENRIVRLDDRHHRVEISTSLDLPETGRSTDPLYNEVSRLKVEDENGATDMQKSA